MYNVSAKPHFLGEKKRINEIRMFAEMFLKEISEALAPSDVRNIINTYMAKIKDPTSQKDFLMQTAFFLGRKASMSPEELDVALRQHFAKNYDPAKLARGQTPTQGAQAQAQKQPPPLPQQKPDFGKLGKPSGNLPSLKNLAGQETQPFWKKQGLPPPESLGQEPKSGKVDKSPEKDENYNPSITFIIPSKNEEKAIYHTIESCFKVNYPKDKIEVIVINDGSTDCTLFEMNRAKKDFKTCQIPYKIV